MLNRVAMNLLYLFFSCFITPFIFKVLLLINSINIRELGRYCALIFIFIFYSCSVDLQ